MYIFVPNWYICAFWKGTAFVHLFLSMYLLHRRISCFMNNVLFKTFRQLGQICLEPNYCEHYWQCEITNKTVLLQCWLNNIFYPNSIIWGRVGHPRIYRLKKSQFAWQLCKWISRSNFVITLPAHVGVQNSKLRSQWKSGINHQRPSKTEQQSLCIVIKYYFH